MNTTIVRKLHIIDATDRSIGRIASEAAHILMGKHKTSYLAHIDSGDFVTIKNCKKVKFTGNKLLNKVHHRHSGYPGGLTTTKLSEEFKAHPERVIERAVSHMLPDNRLRSARLKRLAIK